MGAPKTILLFILACTVVVFASCGGAGTALNTAVPTAPQDMAFTNTDTDAPAGSDSLPTIPLDIGEPDRSASAAGGGEFGTVEVLGSGYLQMDGGYIEGDSLFLDPALSENPPIDGTVMAYGMYKATGLLGKRALALNLEGIPGALGEGYFVGIADYTKGHWRWFGPAMFPEYEVDLYEIHSQLVTHLGNFYFIIVAPEGNTVEHVKSTLIWGIPDDNSEPGFPHHLVASDGQHAEAVGLSWVAGNGAALYQVFRKPLFHDGDWQLIGETDKTHYADAPLPDYVLFAYRVRGVNEAGESRWSNVDTGFAGGGDDPCVIEVTLTTISGDPIPGVAIGLVGMGEELVRHTNGEGKAWLADLPHGRYLVAAHNPDLTFFPAYEAVDMRTKNHEAIYFNAAPTEAFHRVFGFVVTPDPDNENGGIMPLAGVYVVSVPLDESSDPIVTQTDENGFYVINGVPHGINLVGAEAEGYNFLPPFHEVVVNGVNPPDRRDFLAVPVTDPGQ